MNITTETKKTKRTKKGVVIAYTMDNALRIEALIFGENRIITFSPESWHENSVKSIRNACDNWLNNPNRK